MTFLANHPVKKKGRVDPFDRWAIALVAAGELSQRSVDKYRTLWNAWLGWLQLRSVAWHAASAALIEEFLQGAAPGQGGRRPALNPERMSSYTRQRYWRLLQGVYATGVKDGTITTSPAMAVPQVRRPTIARRDRQSQVLEPYLFALLRKPETRSAIIPVNSDADWWHVRDRAILALLVETGITTSELIALRGKNIRRADHAPLNLQPARQEKGTGLSLALEVPEGSDTVGRTLVLAASSGPALLNWMRKRQVLLEERAGRSQASAAQGEPLQSLAIDAPLFVSRRARDSDTPLPPMEPVTVYYTVSQALKRLRHAQADVGTTKEDEPYVAKGPAVIRNSVIRIWLDTLGTKETVKRAGLKNADSLRLGAIL